MRLQKGWFTLESIRCNVITKPKVDKNLMKKRKKYHFFQNATFQSKEKAFIVVMTFHKGGVLDIHILYLKTSF